MYSTILFSTRYLFKAGYLLARHPSSIPKLRNGFAVAALHIDGLRKKKWKSQPRISKRVYGFEICLNPEDLGISPAIGIDGSYEPHVTELFRKLVKKNMTIVDVGANIGWYSLMGAKMTGPEGKVVAFEPAPSNYSLLTQSVMLNGFSNITVIQKCVADTEEERDLYLGKGNLGSHSIIPRAGREIVRVESTTLDSFFPETDKIDILKVDVEGLEPEVISGGLNTLSRCDNVIIEWNQKSWTRFGSVLDKLFRNFEVFELIRSPFLLRKVVRDELVQGSRATNLYMCNLNSD